MRRTTAKKIRSCGQLFAGRLMDADLELINTKSTRYSGDRIQL